MECLLDAKMAASATGRSGVVQEGKRMGSGGQSGAKWVKVGRE